MHDSPDHKDAVDHNQVPQNCTFNDDRRKLPVSCKSEPDRLVQYKICDDDIRKEINDISNHRFTIPVKDESELRITPTKTGDFQVQCSQLCGSGHTLMVAPVHVVSAGDFQQWLPKQQKIPPKTTTPPQLLPPRASADDYNGPRLVRIRQSYCPQYRLRVGEIRVFYDVTKNVVEILAIIPKSDAAGWLEKAGTES
jgi:hypothetical protein